MVMWAAPRGVRPWRPSAVGGSVAIDGREEISVPPIALGITMMDARHDRECRGLQRFRGVVCELRWFGGWSPMAGHRASDYSPGAR